MEAVIGSLHYLYNTRWRGLAELLILVERAMRRPRMWDKRQNVSPAPFLFPHTSSLTAEAGGAGRQRKKLSMSKPFKLFMKNVDALFTDCEFAEYIAQFHTLLSDSEKRGFEFQKKSKRYPLLSSKDNTEKRKETAYHLRRTIYSSYIKDLYEEVCLYLVRTMEIIVSGNKNNFEISRVLGGSKVTITPKQIIEMGTYEQIVQFMMKQLFQIMESVQKENEGKVELNIIKQYKNKFKLSINQNYIDNAMPFLKLRHVLVHSDGVPEESFIKEFPQFKPPKDKRRIQLTHEIIKEAYDNITKLIQVIDIELETKKLV